MRCTRDFARDIEATGRLLSLASDTDIFLRTPTEQFPFRTGPLQLAVAPPLIVGTHVPRRPSAEGSVHCPDTRRTVNARRDASNKSRIIAELSAVTKNCISLYKVCGNCRMFERSRLFNQIEYVARSIKYVVCRTIGRMGRCFQF